MKKYIGLWIDHEKTFVVIIVNGDQKINKIESEVESHIKTLGGSRTATPYGPQDVATERKLERKRKQHLHQYYQKIIDTIKDAHQIFIFGPGAAKSELEKEMKKFKELTKKITGVAPADKMTEGQIVAKVKKFFEEKK
ncbi:MAG: hypothetical protein JSW07_04855 [bacterium]|nr:MAG: hypothetical protein JSW07_04855 [bacterium]